MTTLDRRVGGIGCFRSNRSRGHGGKQRCIASVMATEQHATARKYAGAFLQTFTFHSRRRHDPLLAAIGTMKLLYAEGRRVLPDRVPMAHLVKSERALIFEAGSAALRDCDARPFA